MIGLLNANALHIPLADCSVQMVATSPPYYGLRDYKVAGQLGLEPTPEEYVANLVAVFREVRRVLRDDGVVFLNLGDSYWGGKGASAQAWSTAHTDRDTMQKPHHQIAGMGDTRPTDGKHEFIKPKDLIGIPWRVAFALQADGWYLRSDIIWSKPNPMPESVTDRPTKAHEYVFLLTKSQKYYWDQETVREKAIDDKDKFYKKLIKNPHKGQRDPGGKRDTTGGFQNATYNPAGRNLRTVWTIATAPYKGAHFATWPPKLVEPMIKAGSRPGDTVLDPFAGSGTTLMVARQLGRSAIGLDLSFTYLKENATKRLELDKLKAWCAL